MDDVMISVL